MNIQKIWPKLIGPLLGAIGGFFYWKYVGCQSGTCPIKSVWYLTVLWGAVLGYFAGDIVIDLIKKIRKNA